MTAGDCWGLQPDVVLRIAVVPAGDKMLLVWLRGNAYATAEFTARLDSFEQMLASIRFSDRPVQTTVATTVAPAAAASPVGAGGAAVHPPGVLVEQAFAGSFGEKPIDLEPLEGTSASSTHGAARQFASGPTPARRQWARSARAAGTGRAHVGPGASVEDDACLAAVARVGRAADIPLEQARRQLTDHQPAVEAGDEAGVHRPSPTRPDGDHRILDRSVLGPTYQDGDGPSGQVGN